jgi:hypothetical protein
MNDEKQKLENDRDKAKNAESLPVPHPPKPVDPTRYGDWEINGKCVDF